MAVLSCLRYKTIPTSCIEYVHPWTDSCRDATLGLLMHSFQHSLRTYTTVYLFTAIMRGKKPSVKVATQTISAILQSTVFLTTHAYGFAMCLCTIRRIFGSFNVLSVSFIPAFLSSLVAIHLERPSRRTILCLYVTNVATETLFRMAVDRGLVKPIKFGEVVIFTVSTACLLYRLRGDHSDDSIFSLLKYVVGDSEERLCPPLPDSPGGSLPDLSATASSSKLPRVTTSTRWPAACSLPFISNALRVYRELIRRCKAQPKSPCCPHENGCVFYTLQGGCKMLAVGYGVQVLLRTVLSLRKIWRQPSMLPRIMVNNKVLHLGAFLGLFSATFRGVLCGLRWARGEDAQEHAIPAGLLAGLAFCFYPDNTAALYVMWKAIQMAYAELVEKGYLPGVPGGTILLYSFSTAVLFHAAFLEPQNLRSSYVRFLDGLSGGRMVAMSRKPLDQFGMDTSHKLFDVLTKLKINQNPRYKFRLFGNGYPQIPAL